jgi:hypothetical protein
MRFKVLVPLDIVLLGLLDPVLDPVLSIMLGPVLLLVNSPGLFLQFRLILSHVVRFLLYFMDSLRDVMCLILVDLPGLLFHDGGLPLRIVPRPPCLFTIFEVTSLPGRLFQVRLAWATLVLSNIRATSHCFLDSGRFMFWKAALAQPVVICVGESYSGIGVRLRTAIMRLVLLG